MSRILEHQALWTSAEVASALGVGVSSIKRWTDEELLESVKTVGGHRRYTLEAIYRFARQRNLATNGLPPLDALLDTSIGDSARLIASLLADLESGSTANLRTTVAAYLGQSVRRTAFLDLVLGDLLRQIGELWEKGAWTVQKEHRASYAVAEAIDRMRPALHTTGSLAILSCPPGELHSLPLHMVRIVLEWNGWRSDFLGADVPWESLHDAVDGQSPELLLFSSRSSIPYNSPEFRKLVAHCRRKKVGVGIGGYWARGGTRAEGGVNRFRTLNGFERWLRGNPTA